MPGFACVIANNIDFAGLNLEHKGLATVIAGKKVFMNCCIYRFVNDKFLNDKVFNDDDEIFSAIEGFVLNFKDLQNSKGCSDYFNTTKKMYQADGNTFFKSFRGEFSGLLYDKIKQKWLIFTNHTASKPVFYFRNQDVFICASELQLVTQILRKLGYKYSLDILGSYFLLTYGFMLEDYTLIKEIKKLKPGNYITIEDNKSEVKVYNVFDNNVIVKHGREEILNNLDILFKKAISLEYEKDLEYGYKHIETLSGGLDSRMNAMVAHELGYDNILNVTFSQSNYWDERIAKKIAADLGNEFLFYALDNGNYLGNTLHDAVIANGGMVFYSGAAHSLSFLRKINFGPFGMLHSGQIGDAVLGSFLSKPRKVKPQPFAGAISSYLSTRISSEISKILKNYESEEIFKFYNRAFNGVVNGNWMANQFTETCSPFLDVDFLQYALSIPPAMKFKEKIYIEWILAKHPDAAKYVWEKLRTKITTNSVIVKMKWFARGVRYKLLPERPLDSMTPWHYWYRTNPKLRKYMDDYFWQNVHVLENYRELKGDCEELFKNGKIIEKVQAMTLLEAMHLHFD